MRHSKTRKASLKNRRRTLKRRRSSKKGGADSQALIPPTPAIQVSVPTPSNKIV